MKIDWGTNVLDKRFKIKYGLMLTCLGALTSCASNKYTINSTHDVTFTPEKIGGSTESILAKAATDTTLAPGIWRASSNGFKSTLLYIPSQDAKSTAVQLQKSDSESPSVLVHSIFEIQGLMRRRNTSDALAKTRLLRAAYPDVPDLGLLQASISVLAGDTAGAITLLNEVLKANPDDAEGKELLLKISGGAKQP